MSARRLGFESLESRQLCAGNITATFFDNELKITGDAAANFVDVQLRKSNGNFFFVVTGKTFDGQFDLNKDPVAIGAATTINGLAKPFRATLTAESKITITAGDGNDAVVVGGTGQQMGLTGLLVATGTGSDYASVKGVGISSKTTAKFQLTRASNITSVTEAGDDKLVLQGFQAKAGGVGIITGGGNDAVSITDVSAKAAGTAFSLNAGEGNDLFTVEHSELNGTNLDGGAGNDSFRFHNATFNKLTASGGDGNDLTTINYNRFFNTATFNGGTGNDRINIKTAEFQKNYAFNGNEGNDTMTVFHARFLGALAFTGDIGNDKFALVEARLQNVTLSGGDGKDTMSIETATGNDITVNGDNGSDFFSIKHAEIHGLYASMGTSNDADTVTAEIFRTQFINVDLGAGNNDLLNLINNIDIKQKANYNGGAGTGDRLVRGPRMLPGVTTFTGFEGFI